MSSPMIEVKNLKKQFTLPSTHGKYALIANAVNGVTFSIDKGEILGLVGESGCGKTVTGKMILKLIEPTEGEILFDGLNIIKMSFRQFRKMRRDIQTVFQDPNSALDPKMTIESILAEPLLLHGICDRSNEKKEVSRLLEAVGLEESVGKTFPYELSSGQKQRVSIAKAISTKPRFILCDEPVSALDVSVQSQILNLLLSFKENSGMTYLFISHNLGVVRHMCDRVAVMYLGRIVETGTTEEVFADPKHPYTKALLSSSPVPDPSLKPNHIELPGEVPLCTDIPEGCPFHPRCREASQKCRNRLPGTTTFSPFHSAACHLYD